MKRAMIGTMLVLSTMLTAAQADTLVFRDTLRPNGHDRSRAARLADGRKCGGARNGDFPTAITESFTACMQARGWTLDHVIPERPSAYLRAPSYGSSPAPVDDGAQRMFDLQQQQINTQQMINEQNQENTPADVSGSVRPTAADHQQQSLERLRAAIP
jgi:hypothetical protein